MTHTTYARDWRLHLGALTLSVLAFPTLAQADVPHGFQDGDVIVADEVNSNFSNLDGRLAPFEGAISVDGSDVAIDGTLTGSEINLDRQNVAGCGALLRLQTNSDADNSWVIKNSSPGCDVPEELGTLQFQPDGAVTSMSLDREGSLSLEGSVQASGLNLNRITPGGVCGAGISMTVNDDLDKDNGWLLRTSDQACHASTLGELHFVPSQGTASVFRLDRSGNLTIAGSLTESSDARLKTDITDLDGALDAILSINGVSYRWRDPAKGSELHLGVLAQDVEAVFPELVSTDRDGMKSVHYTGLVAPLIEALQEQQAIIEAQALRIDMLETMSVQAELLEARLSRLEAMIATDGARR